MVADLLEKKMEVHMEAAGLDALSLRGRTCLLGLSGGPDSMALFVVLEKLSRTLGFELVACHINHRLRGEQADREQESLRLLCRERDVAFEETSVDVADFAQREGLSTQAAGHLVRKAFFRKVAKEHGASHLFLAHHLDDRIESFMMHLLHGAGSGGLTTLPLIDTYSTHPHLSVVRPLYQTTKKEILDFCKEQEIPFFEDPSNAESTYTRNSIRLELLPHLEARYNPNLSETLSRTIEILSEESQVLTKLTDDFFTKHMVIHPVTDPDVDPKRDPDNEAGVIISVDKKAFQKQEKAIQRRIVTELCKSIIPAKEAEGALDRKEHDAHDDARPMQALPGYTFEKTETIISLLIEERGLRYYKLSSSYYLEIRYDRLLIIKGNLDQQIAEKKIRQIQEFCHGEISRVQGRLEFTIVTDSDETDSCKTDSNENDWKEIGTASFECRIPLVLEPSEIRAIEQLISEKASDNNQSQDDKQDQDQKQEAKKQSSLDAIDQKILGHLLPESYTSASAPLKLRTRCPGDQIRPQKGRNKPLKKYLIEKKIPKDHRDDLMLLTSGSDILWIPELGVISEAFFAKDDSERQQNEKNMLKITFIPNSV